MNGRRMRFVKLPCLVFGAIALAACTRGGSADELRDSPKPKNDSAEIVLPAADEKDGSIQVEVLTTREEPEMLQAPGKITLADGRTWHIGVLTSGRIEKVNVNLGDSVREGQILAYMHSHDVHEVRAAYQTAGSDLSRAEAAAALAQKNYERAERLYSLKAGSLSDVEIARQEVVNAQGTVRNKQVELEKERIHLEGNLGVAAEPNPNVAEEGADHIPIRASGSGYVLAKNVTPGTVVDPTKDLFVIGDLSHVWMIASVGENNLARLRLGQATAVTTAAYPSERFRGKVTNLAAELDPVTRVMRARIEIENSAMKLRPEMLANAQIEIGGMRPLLLISSEAVQQMNDQDVVFVRKSSDRFEVRPVRVGQSINGRIVVLEGLKPGEAVVTRGSFILKSQRLKSALEGN